jgi:hypothetical protein
MPTNRIPRKLFDYHPKGRRERDWSPTQRFEQGKSLNFAVVVGGDGDYLRIQYPSHRKHEIWT